MAKKKGTQKDGGVFERLQESLEEVTDSLRTVGEALGGEVASGIGTATRWAAFSQAVSPLLETSPGGMTGEQIESALADDPGEGEAVAETKKRKAAFIEAHGQQAWDECIRSAGTLRIDRALGRSRITKVDDDSP